MTSSASLALQDALGNLIKADAAASALQGQRVYDRAPQNVNFPYTAMGEFQVLDDGAGCIESACEIYATLHVWSRATGKAECQQLAGALKACLSDAALDLGPDWSLCELQFRSADIFTDVDGVTTHGVITLRALIDPAS